MPVFRSENGYQERKPLAERFRNCCAKRNVDAAPTSAKAPTLSEQHFRGLKSPLPQPEGRSFHLTEVYQYEDNPTCHCVYMCGDTRFCHASRQSDDSCRFVRDRIAGRN